MVEQNPTSTVTPEAIVDIATGYMAAKQLFAASRIGLFAALSEAPKTAVELAESTNTAQRVVRMLADGMAAQGLLHREDGRYRLAAEARTYLAGSGADLDLSPFLRFLNEISYPHWLQFDNSVDRDGPGELDMSGDRWSTFMGGVMTYNRLHARMLAQSFDFAGFENILDLGGLASVFTVEALRANPDARATLVFHPDSTDMVRSELTEAGLAERTTIVGAETTTAKPDGQYDLVMLNHVVHRFGAEDNLEILRNARAAAMPGTRLVLLDFYLDDDPEQRRIDALHATEYLVIDGTVVYPIERVRDWLTRTGWKQTDMLHLPGSPRALIAEAV